MSRSANREAFLLVPETCPEVDRYFGSTEDAISDLNKFLERYREAEQAARNNLRDGLIKKCEEAEEVERELREKAEEIQRLEDQVELLKDELVSAKEEINDLIGRLDAAEMKLAEESV